MEPIRWNEKFKPWGDRLNFLSPAQRHLASGTMKLLPPRGDKKRVI